MQSKILKSVKIIAEIALIGFLVWTFLIKPEMVFHSNERKIEEAAKRYFELNSHELPTGERVKTLSLQKLYDEGLIENDFYIPLSKKTCSNEKSWAKVRRENGIYTYYVYLECGYLKSKVDHEGPKITLNGKEKITISIDSKYKEEGIKSVVDEVDGKLKTDDVTIKGSVDTSKIGTYEITYIAFDKLSNKTVVTREVKVVRKLYSEIKKDLKDKQIYKGDPTNNYLRLSNILFRIVGYDDNKNITIIADTDIANINYTKIDKWLDYFYNNLNKKTKEMIIKSKYCSMTIDEQDLSKTECDSYTKEKNVYIPSIVDINKAKEDTGSFMQARTLSWVADKKDEKQAYVTRRYAYLPEDQGIDYFLYDAIENYGIRPMMKIKGSSLVVTGDGSKNNPYTFGDIKKVKGSDLLNTREVGEYVTDSNSLWRIVKIMKDGTTKVISAKVEFGREGNLTCFPTNTDQKYIYNPKDKNSVAYCINNQATKYFDVSNFENHEIEVPIYKNTIVYGEEIKTKKYKAVLSAPDMYEMFSAAPEEANSYWLINSSEQKNITGAITEIGVPVNRYYESYLRLHVRPVAYYKKNVIITSGRGTENNPYKIR